MSVKTSQNVMRPFTKHPIAKSEAMFGLCD